MATSVSFTNDIVIPFTALQSAVNDFLKRKTPVINYPLLNVVQIKSSVRTLRGFLSDASIKEPVLDSVLTKMHKVLDSYSLQPNKFVKTFIKSDFVNQTTSFDPATENIDLNQVKSVSYHTIRNGETLEKIALTSYGDVKLWKSIAEFNGLEYPYITNITPKPDKTLGTGERIAIPKLAGLTLSDNLILGANTASLDNSLNSLGSDIFLNSDGDIEFSQNDLVLVSGLENMKQSLNIKLNVQRGELVHHPQFGMTNLKGYRVEKLLSAKAASELSATILTDSRVAGIKNQQVTITGDTIGYKVEIEIEASSEPILLEGSLKTK